MTKTPFRLQYTDTSAVWAWIARHVNIRQHPIAIKRLSGKGRAESVAHGAVCAVAPDQPIGRDGFFVPVRMPQHRVDAVGTAREA